MQRQKKKRIIFVKEKRKEVISVLTVILAGGASRRMGRDKALLPYQGTTLLQAQIDKYSVIGPVAVSVDRAGRFPFTGAAELPDLFPGQGPLNGLIAGFQNTEEESVFLTAVDLPHGDPALALRLEALRRGNDVCIIEGGAKGPEPLFAVYGRSCLPAAKTCMENGERSIRAMLRLLSVRAVTQEELPEFDLRHILKNVNTPEDYAGIHST